MIIAPHEPRPQRIQEIETMIKKMRLNSIRLSELKNNGVDFHCLIIDRIGLLANIYSLGEVAFVGGSFHHKVHNVLEPAVYGIPVIFGPKINTSSEAQNMAVGFSSLLNKNSIAFLASTREKFPSWIK